MERYQRRGKATNVRELIKIDGLPTVDEEKENRRKKARWRKAQDEVLYFLVFTCFVLSESEFSDPN